MLNRDILKSFNARYGHDIVNYVNTTSYRLYAEVILNSYQSLRDSVMGTYRLQILLLYCILNGQQATLQRTRGQVLGFTFKVSESFTFDFQSHKKICLLTPKVCFGTLIKTFGSV